MNNVQHLATEKHGHLFLTLNPPSPPSPERAIDHYAHHPVAPFKQRRVRIVRRLVERPKTVYERFPSFKKNKVLDFTELFQGFAVTKSCVVKPPYNVRVSMLFIRC